MVVDVDPDAVVLEGTEAVVVEGSEDVVVVAGGCVVESPPPLQTSTPLKSSDVTFGTVDPELGSINHM